MAARLVGSSDSMAGLEQAIEEAKAAAAQLWMDGQDEEAAKMDQMVHQLEAVGQQIAAVEVHASLYLS